MKAVAGTAGAAICVLLPRALEIPQLHIHYGNEMERGCLEWPRALDAAWDLAQLALSNADLALQLAHGAALRPVHLALDRVEVLSGLSGRSVSACAIFALVVFSVFAILLAPC